MSSEAPHASPWPLHEEGLPGCSLPNCEPPNPPTLHVPHFVSIHVENVLDVERGQRPLGDVVELPRHVAGQALKLALFQRHAAATIICCTQADTSRFPAAIASSAPFASTDCRAHHLWMLE